MSARVDQRPWVDPAGRALTERFGENIRLLRTRVNISQETLALRADMHRTEISMLEAGSRMPRLDTFRKLAAGLEVEVALLLEGIAYRCPPGTAAPGEFEITPPGRPGRRRS